MKIYSAYRGDEFVDVGTAEELAERLGMSVETVKWLSYPSAHKRAEGAVRLLTYEVDMEDEDGDCACEGDVSV